MPNLPNNKATSSPGKSGFELFTEIMGWLQIMASPFLLGLIAGALIYFSKPIRGRLFLGISIAALGLVAGVIWATKIWKKRGTIHFLSKIKSTPVPGSDNVNDIET